MPHKNIVLAEGPDDRGVVRNLARIYGLTGQFEFNETIEGIQQLLKVLPQELRPGASQVFAILVDADAEVSETADPHEQFVVRWRSIRDRLRRIGYDVPEDPDPQGLVLDHDDLPRIGLWLMPDNIHRGMLEDFMEMLIAEEDLLWPHAVQAVSDLPHRPFSEAHVKKAEIHTWLAWQEVPGTRMGVAITKRFVDPNSPHAALFMDWLKNVFHI